MGRGLSGKDGWLPGQRLQGPVSNEYGCPYVEKRDSGFYLGLENANGGDDEVPVSSAFAAAWQREFASTLEPEETGRP